MFVLLTTATAMAQPSDATVRRDLRSPGQLSLELLPARNRPERLGPDSWEFLRAAVIVRHSDFPGIDVEISGLAQYYSTNGRSWTYRTFLVTTNRYIGLPDPTPAEIDALVRAQPSALFAGMAPSVLGLPSVGPVLADDATFNWHTPNSVSFPINMEFDYITARSDTVTVAHLRGRYTLRFYRDATDRPWTNYNSTPDGDPTTVTTRSVPRSILECASTVGEIEHGVTPVRSLDECVAEAEGVAAAFASRAGSAEERASFRVAAAPAAPITTAPLRFRDFTGAVDAIHQALLTMDRSALETFLRTIVADRYLASPGVLNAEGITLVSNALFEVFSTHGNYRSEFCRPLRYDSAHSPPNGLMLVGTIEGVTALISVEDMGSQWSLGRLDITVRHDDEGIALSTAAPCR